MTRMRLAGRCQPPLAWLTMILSQPRLAMSAHQPEPIHLTRERAVQLGDVQDAVNSSFRYQRETRDVWGRWKWRHIFTLAGRWRWIRIGDCDDYAVEKLRRLLGLGWGGSLRLVACQYEATGHLVLAIDTTDTTLILDNRLSAVWPWDSARFDSYRWIASSVPGKKLWTRIVKMPTLEDLARRAGA